MTIEATDPNTEAHPIARKSGATKWILILVGLVIIGGVVFFVRGRMRASAGGPAPASSADRVVPVQVAPVVQRDVPIYLEGLGNVLPIASVQVHTQVDGRLDSVNFKEGQKVRKGDVLAQVDPRAYYIQLHNAEATLAKDSAQVRNGQLNLDRYKTLRQQNLIPQQQVDDQQTLFDSAAATIKADEAAVESAKLNLDYARIISPIDGVVGVRQVDPGNIVHAADAMGIVVVTQLDPIAVFFTLPQDDLTSVAAAFAKGPIAVDALSREGAQKLATGTLLVIDNQINTTTATIRLKATFANPDRVLWPNAFVKARILLNTRMNAIVVPSTVPQKGPQGTFAYVVGPDKTVQAKPIEIDTTTGDLSIVKGLAVGEQVVTDGQNQLRPGAKVAPRPMDAKADGTKDPDVKGADSKGGDGKPKSTTDKNEKPADAKSPVKQ